MSGGVFTIRARKCLRCGRLLTSPEAIEKGYGCQCLSKAKAEKKAAEPVSGQLTFFDLMGGSNDNDNDNDDNDKEG
jgi:hypothetical protein